MQLHGQWLTAKSIIIARDLYRSRDMRQRPSLTEKWPHDVCSDREVIEAAMKSPS